MKIEAVTACLNYADYLHHAMPRTVEAVDRLVVVTGPEDEETQAVCEHHGVDCVVTDAFRRYGSEFNKGAALNEGLAVLDRDDWLLIVDADILIPEHVRGFLEGADLDAGQLYGADRRNCRGLATLRECCEAGGFQHLPMMDRVNINGGFPPVGYFQLWHSSLVGHGPWYEDHYPYADRTDVTFAKRFERRKYLPTWVVHLDVDGHAGGTNWRGRVSERFVSEDQLRLDLDLRQG